MFIKHKETKEVEVIDKILCNCCGREISETTTGIISISHIFSYFSNLFIDGERHSFEVCEDCYAQWIKTFKYAPEGFGKNICDKNIKINFEEWKN